MERFVHLYYAVPKAACDTFPDPSIFLHLIPQNQPVPGVIPHLPTLLLCSIQIIVCCWIILLIPMKYCLLLLASFFTNCVICFLVDLAIGPLFS